MDNLFSINAAATLLECDRQTIVRALRYTPADDGEGRARRCRMSTIFWAMQAHVQKRSKPSTNPINYGGFADLDADLANDRATLPLFAAFNTAFAMMEAEPSLTKRRQIAISFAPKMIKKCIEAYCAHCHAEGYFIDADTRAFDCMWSRLLEAFEKPCKWTPEEVRRAFRVYEDDEA
jgi:hypothetical protein